MKLLAEKCKDFDDFSIYITLFKLYKSYLLLISDQKEMGLGNVSLGNPPIINGLKSLSASYKLFGINKKLLSTIIVERASYLLKAPVLLLLFIKMKKKEEDIVKFIVTFLNDILTKLENN